MKLTFTLASAFALGANAGGFLDSCCRVAFGGTTVSAKCGNGRGQWFDASKDVNSCIGNNNGQLTFAINGNYIDSCRSCGITNPLNIHCPAGARKARGIVDSADETTPYGSSDEQLEIRGQTLAKRLDTEHWNLACDCRKADGSIIRSSIPLDVVLSNWGGGLGC